MPLKPIYPRDRELGGFRWSSKLFNKKIDTDVELGECYGWLGSSGPQGPLIGVRKIQPDGSDRAQMTQARRILFAENTGTALKPGEPVYHSCGNQNCMTFEHLTLTRPAPKMPQRAPKPPKPKPAAKKPGRPQGSKTKPRPGDAN